MKRLEPKFIRMSELFSLFFGMLMMLIIFGDQMPIHWVGNLDTIFGTTIAPLMDMIYPLSSVIVFLGYGKSKGPIQLRFTCILLFFVFIASIALIQFDDVFVVFGHPIVLPDIYWTTARWLYFIIAPVTFFIFGNECEKN